MIQWKNQSKITEKSDKDLVHSLREGNSNALAILYDRYAGLVYSVAFNILGNKQEAEDLTQEIFLTFWKKDRFDTNRGTLSSFLGLLTRSRAIDKIRKSHTTRGFLERWQKITSDESFDCLKIEQISVQEQQKKLHQALIQLPMVQQQILTMHYYDGLSHAKIAKALNLSLGTVKSRLRQSLLQLKQLLLENDGI